MRSKNTQKGKKPPTLPAATSFPTTGTPTTTTTTANANTSMNNKELIDDITQSRRKFLEQQLSRLTQEEFSSVAAQQKIFNQLDEMTNEMEDDDENSDGGYDLTEEEEELLYQASLNASQSLNRSILGSTQNNLNIIQEDQSQQQQQQQQFHNFHTNSASQQSQQRSSQLYFFHSVITIALKFFQLSLIASFCLIILGVYSARNPSSSESNLKQYLFKAVVASTPEPAFITTELFTFSYTQDFPFRFFSYSDRSFSNYLQSPVFQESCDPEYDFEFASCCPIKKPTAKPLFGSSKGSVQQSQTATSSSSSQQPQTSNNIKQQQTSSDQSGKQSTTTNQQQQQQRADTSGCRLLNDKLFSDSFIPILYIHGHGVDSSPTAINFFNAQLHKLLIYENEKNLKSKRYTLPEQRKKQKQFKFYSIDMRHALSMYSTLLIDKETIAVARTLSYLRTRSSEKITVICHSMGGFVCLDLISALHDDLLSGLSQVIFLNAPLATHPLNSNYSFKEKYNNIYNILSNQKHILERIRLLSFTSGHSDTIINPIETHLRFPLKSSMHFELPNLRDVFASPSHHGILSYTPFLNLLAKYFVMDVYYDAFSIDTSASIKRFFLNFDIHYEDQVSREFIAFNQTILETQCAKLQTAFEHSHSINMLSLASRLSFSNSLNRTMNQKYLSNDARAFLERENLLCLRITTTEVRASNLMYVFRTTIPSAAVKLFTFITKSKSNTPVVATPTASPIIKEIFPEFSYFFGSVYTHKQTLNSSDVYLVFSPRTDTFLHNEYKNLYNQTFLPSQTRLTLSNFQETNSPSNPASQSSPLLITDWKSSHSLIVLPSYPNLASTTQDVPHQRFCSSFNSNYIYRIAKSILSDWVLSLSSMPASKNSPQLSQFHSWNRADFNLLLLRDETTKQRIQTSFSYAENDCDYASIFAFENKEIWMLHDSVISEINSINPVSISSIGNSTNRGLNSLQRNPFLMQERNFQELLRTFCASIYPILLNSHVILCCFLITFQIKSFNPRKRILASSQLTLLMHNLFKVTLLLSIGVFFNLYIQQLLFDYQVRGQPQFLHNNFASKDFISFSSSFWTSILTATMIVSTYIIGQLAFRVGLFLSYCGCVVFSKFLNSIPFFESIRANKHCEFVKIIAVVLGFLLLSNNSYKWAILVGLYWFVLGYTQKSNYRSELVENLKNGFAYLLFLYAALNATPFLSVAERSLFGIIQQQQQQQQWFKNLLFVEEFSSEFFTMVAWLFLLIKIENLVMILRDPLQILFLLFSLFLSFFTYLPLSYVNDFLKSLAYLLIAFNAYSHNKKYTLTPVPNQQQSTQSVK